MVLLKEAPRGCIEGLPGGYRMVFVLRTFAGLNYADIGATLDWPVDTVKSRLNQARKRLRDCLKQRNTL